MSITLTPELAEARRACLEHLAHRPKRHEAIEFEAWRDRAAVLNADLEALLKGEPLQAATDIPKIQEEPMPKGQSARNREAPEVRLAGLVAAYHAAPNAKARGNRKRTILEVVRKFGLTMPELVRTAHMVNPRGTGGSGKARKPLPESEPPNKTSLSPVMQSAIDFGRSIQRHVEKAKPLGDIRIRIRGIRADLWLLLADLERLSAFELSQLISELALLDFATQALRAVKEQSVA